MNRVDYKSGRPQPPVAVEHGQMEFVAAAAVGDAAFNINYHES
jgi:hypothetical protein